MADSEDLIGLESTVLALADTVVAPNVLGVSGFDRLSSKGDFEVEAADGEAVDASGTANVK